MIDLWLTWLEFYQDDFMADFNIIVYGPAAFLILISLFLLL